MCSVEVCVSHRAHKKNQHKGYGDDNIILRPARILALGDQLGLVERKDYWKVH